MKKIKQLFSDSLHEFTVTKNLVLCGLMAALAIVLSIVASISIGPYVKIGFSGLPNRIVEFLFGPVVGCIFGGALDLLKFMIKPDGPFFFGFTFNAMLAGLIYGCLLYHKPLSIKRIVIAEFLVKLIVNCGLLKRQENKKRTAPVLFLSVNTWHFLKAASYTLLLDFYRSLRPVPVL